jgi:hypothetical protein
MEHSKLDNVLNDIQNHFHFLFERGFRIHHTASRTSAAWVVILKSDAFNVHSTSDRLNISLAATDNREKNWFELFEIVYFVSNKKDFIGVYEDDGEYKDAASYRGKQLQRFATILRKYLGEITEFFTAEPVRNFEKLLSIRKEARELYSKALNEKLSRMNLP